MSRRQDDGRVRAHLVQHQKASPELVLHLGSNGVLSVLMSDKYSRARHAQSECACVIFCSHLLQHLPCLAQSRQPTLHGQRPASSQATLVLTELCSALSFSMPVALHELLARSDDAQVYGIGRSA